MERPILRIVGLITLVASLASCGGYGPILRTMRGNLAYDRGEYQTALIHYMSALEEESGAWIRFNIGNVYFALGEQEAALQVWQEARDQLASDEDKLAGTDVDLVYAASYNRGVLLYQQGRYRQAYDEFRYALSVNTRSRATKANLELALRKLQAAEAAAAGGEPSPGGVSDTAAQAEGQDPGEQTLRILEYVRRKEARQWFANRDTEQQQQSQDW